jgi:2-oxoglutarate dehydrogenase complex dehydrogenase (E1) component-like enzyme
VATKKAQPTDWESIEGAYRAGVLSTREIAGQYGVSHTAINKRAKAEGWDRDLSAKIQAKAEALVSRREVSREVSSQKAATEREIIEANAERIAQVRGEHQADIQRVRSLGLALLAELEGQTSSRELLDQLGELLRAPDENGTDKLNDLYRKVISTPSRVDSAKKVAETLKHAIGMEREAYGLDDKKPVESTGDITITF